jgi:hypothetical protein
MYTIVETPSFIEDAKKLWAEEERVAFCVWIAGNPEAGDVIPREGLHKLQRDELGTDVMA